MRHRCLHAAHGVVPTNGEPNAFTASQPWKSIETKPTNLSIAIKPASRLAQAPIGRDAFSSRARPVTPTFSQACTKHIPQKSRCSVICPRGVPSCAVLVASDSGVQQLSAAAPLQVIANASSSRSRPICRPRGVRVKLGTSLARTQGKPQLLQPIHAGHTNNLGILCVLDASRYFQPSLPVLSPGSVYAIRF